MIAEKISEFETFDKTNEQDKSVLRKIRKYNFYKDKLINLMSTELGVENPAEQVIPVIANNNFYLLIRYADKKTWHDTAYLIGLFDILKRDDIGFTYRIDKDLSEMWRNALIYAYGEDYKKALIKLLNERKNAICNEYDRQIDKLQKGLSM